jgi:hypothetical protein
VRDEHGLRVFENKILRNMFQPTRDEVTKNKTAHNEDPHNLYSLLNVVRVLI